MEPRAVRRNRRLSGPPRNYGGIRPPMHPAPRRCSSVKYSRYSPSSRLAGRAPRRPRCVAVITRRTTEWTVAADPHVETPNSWKQVLPIPRDGAFGIRGNLPNRRHQEGRVPPPGVIAPALVARREDLFEIGLCRTRETKSRHPVSGLAEMAPRRDVSHNPSVPVHRSARTRRVRAHRCRLEVGREAPSASAHPRVGAAAGRAKRPARPRSHSGHSPAWTTFSTKASCSGVRLIFRVGTG